MQNLLRGAFPRGDRLRAETLRRIARSSVLYVVFIIPRSGSTWLTELTMKSGRLGAPQEWFNDSWIYGEEPALGCLPPRLRQTLDINDYVEAIAIEGRGVAGIELSVFQAEMLCELIEKPLDPGLFKGFFYLRRRDLIAQAVSLYRSVSSGYFHSYQAAADQLDKLDRLAYSAGDLLHWLQFLVESEQRMEQLFKAWGVQPMALTYEDMLADPLAVLQGMAGHLNLEAPQSVPETTLRVLRNETSESWCERLKRDLPPNLRNTVDIGLRARLAHLELLNRVLTS